MQRGIFFKSHAQALLLAGMLVAGPALAERGNDDGDRHEQKGEHRNHKSHEHRHDGDAGSGRGDDRVRLHAYFGDQHRSAVRDYYAREYHSGHCPPGLAKKHNGCRPPGLARKWHIGRPLPRDVIYYDLPPEIIVQLGVPLPRHRYVRVAGDILLIAIGTGIVVDAIEDLGDR